jgi:uncharacterized membrane-anchored protein
MKKQTRIEIFCIVFIIVCWVILAAIGHAARGTSNEWLVEAADIAKIIVPVGVLVFLSVRKMRNKTKN